MKKDKVVAQLHKRINKASRKIDNLALQTHLAKEEGKEAFDKRIKALENQKNKFRDEVRHLKHLTSTAWKDLEVGCNKSWSEMKASIRKATDEFRS